MQGRPDPSFLERRAALLSLFDPKRSDPAGEVAFLTSVGVGIANSFNVIQEVVPHLLVLVPSILSFVTIVAKVVRDAQRKRLRLENARLKKELIRLQRQADGLPPLETE